MFLIFQQIALQPRPSCVPTLDFRIVSKDGGSYCVRCPHCKVIIGIDGDDMSEIRGEQFEHRWMSVWSNEEKGCKGWFEVTRNARFVKELPPR